LSYITALNRKFVICRRFAVVSIDVDEMETDEEGDEEMVAMVTIGDRRVPMDEVTEEMVSQMTPAEKAEYIRLGQQIYEQLYD
jgi:C-terminal general transcription factor TFIIE alpha